MRWAWPMFGIPMAALLVALWAAMTVLLGEPQGWTLLSPFAGGEFYYSGPDHEALMIWLGAAVGTAAFAATWWLPVPWRDALGVGAGLFAFHWWNTMWFGAVGYPGAFAAMAVATLAGPWLSRGAWAPPVSVAAFVPMLWSTWWLLYAPLEPLFGPGPTAPRPWSIVAFGTWLALLFIGGQVTILVWGRRANHPGRGPHTLALGLLIVFATIAVTSHGIRSIYGWGWILPMALWLGAVAWAVRPDGRWIRWCAWGPALLGAAWIPIGWAIGL